MIATRYAQSALSSFHTKCHSLGRHNSSLRLTSSKPTQPEQFTFPHHYTSLVSPRTSCSYRTKTHSINYQTKPLTGPTLPTPCHAATIPEPILILVCPAAIDIPLANPPCSQTIPHAQRLATRFLPTLSVASSVYIQ